VLLCGQRSTERAKHVLTHSLKSIFATLFGNFSLESSLNGDFSMEQHDADGAQQDEAGSFSLEVPQHMVLTLQKQIDNTIADNGVCSFGLQGDLRNRRMDEIDILYRGIVGV
jgi:hypothetical protein